MTMVNGFTATDAEHLSQQERELIARRDQTLGPAYRLFYERPLHIVKGEGVWLYDADGKRYLDAYNNVASIGHCNPHVVNAICEQVKVLNTHTRYLHEGILNYADKLLATFPSYLNHVMFTCTGSEANDLALRIAKQYTGGTGVIVTELAYHGITDLVSAVSPSLGAGVELGTFVRKVRAPDAYRLGVENVARVFAEDVRAAIDDMRANGIKPAAILFDGIFASDGVLSDPAGFAKDAIALAKQEGLLYIADEVQSGFGRTGSHLWGFQRHGVEPDIVTMGKPMGNGQPIAAAVMRSDVVEEFGRIARYFNTYGGNPVSCAAANAVLDFIQNEGLLRNCASVGAYLKAGIEELAKRYEVIGDVRGAGLFLGVELVSDRSTKAPDADATRQVVNGLRERGVLISSAGPMENILKVRPQLIFQRAQADIFIETLDRVLGDLK
ncbi:aspartate aminotransferase family protein [Pseudomonas uvaldensis]|uniref:aspartate aminotransferase family protein n=1 Tax=Pseudomonas uvaldensis TaxID=2878385 RepID=UPI001E626B73|nr:aspartate aminotransferase family protein [Pseudomonas uvaldensis]MCE0463366.1 aspartate aminotransferase family protein [Pseudomonas uvaldensis]